MLDRANYMRASPTNAQSQLSAKLLFNAQFQPGYTVIYHAGINYSAPKASNRPSHAPRAFRSSPSLSWIIDRSRCFIVRAHLSMENRCPLNNFITFSRFRAFIMAEITYHDASLVTRRWKSETKISKLSSPLPRKLGSEFRDPSRRCCRGRQISNFKIPPAIENFDYVRASQFCSPFAGISVSGRNVCSNIIYLHIGETNANFKLFRAIWPTCPNKEKNKRVSMSVDNERSLTCPIWIFPNGCKWRRDGLCVVKATSEKKKEHADKQTCLPVHGTIEFSRRAFRFFSNKRYRRVRAYIIPLSRYLGLCSPFIPTDPRNDESRRRSHCRVRCIETLITAVRGQGTVEKDRFLLSID